MFNIFSGLITSTFKQIHVDMITSLLEGCSVTCTLKYEGSKWDDCPNCEPNHLMGNSSNIYQSGGPIPFTFGECPYCSGRGRLETEITESIDLAPIWDSKNWIKTSGVGLTPQVPNTYLQTISVMSTYAQLQRTKSVIIDTAIAAYGVNEFIREGDPEPCGLGASSFIVTIWKKVS